MSKDFMEFLQKHHVCSATTALEKAAMDMILREEAEEKEGQ